MAERPRAAPTSGRPGSSVRSASTPTVGDNGGVKTRTLLILSALCLFAILGASVVFFLGLS